MARVSGATARTSGSKVPRGRAACSYGRVVDLESSRHDLRRWIVCVSVGEGVGFAIAAGVAILAMVGGVDDPARFLLVIAAGACEGAALATGQYLGMRTGRPLPAHWIGATAIGAAVAWTLGLLPSTLGLDLGTPAVLVLVLIGAVALLGSIPVAQWLALARRDTFRWVPVNMGAWAISILWTFAPSPFVDERSPVALIAALYVLAGVLMAVTFACLTAPLARTLFTATRLRGTARSSPVRRRS